MEPISSLQAEEARLRSKLANNPFFSGASNLFQFLRWMLISTLTGLVVGSVSTIFNFGLKFAVDFRHAHLWVVLFLPVAGLAIVFLYRFFHYENNAGTDTVINSIHKEAHIPLRMSFLIFVSTILTVLCGGSVGREGAAMQIGGSIGEQIGEKLRFNEKDKKIMLMSGISAAFSALFGTPMAAAFLAMEIASIGIMYYAALVPCIWASLTAYMLAKAFHAPFENLGDFIGCHVKPRRFRPRDFARRPVRVCQHPVLQNHARHQGPLCQIFSEPVCSRIYRRCHYYPAFASFAHRRLPRSWHEYHRTRLTRRNCGICLSFENSFHRTHHRCRL